MHIGSDLANDNRLSITNGLTSATEVKRPPETLAQAESPECLCSLCLSGLCSGWALLSALFLQLQLCLLNNPNNFTFRNAEEKQSIMSSTHSVPDIWMRGRERAFFKISPFHLSNFSASSTGLVFYASFHTNHNIYIMCV